MTQQEVADKLNVSNKTLSSWENGRTMPDISYLPAIADLYGITVDELLRFNPEEADSNKEKSVPDENTQQKTNYFAKTIPVCDALIFCGLLFLLSCILFLYSGAPFWLDVLIAVLSLCGIAATTVYLIYWDYTTVNSRTNGEFVATVKLRTAKILFIASMPFLLAATVIIIVFFATNVHDYSVNVGNVKVTYQVVRAHLITFAINAAIFAGYFTAAMIIRIKILNGYVGKECETVKNHNSALLKKICLYSLIPIVAAVICTGVLCGTRFTSTKTYLTADGADELINEMQTICIAEQDTDEYTVKIDITDTDEKRIFYVKKGDYNMTDGEYLLNFPEYGLVGADYDLGNGFTGKVNAAREWLVFVTDAKDEHVQFSSMVFKEYAFTDEAGNERIAVNVSHTFDLNEKATSNANAFCLGDKSFGVKFDESSETYSFYREQACRYVQTAIYVLIFTAVATVAADTVIYFLKRTKYEI